MLWAVIYLVPFAITIAIVLWAWVSRDQNSTPTLRAWRPHDEVLVTALRWRQATKRGEPVGAGESVDAFRPLVLGDGERALAVGGYQGGRWGAEGDGSYIQTKVVYARYFDFSLTAEMINVAANAFRQAAAEKAATPHWIWDAPASVVVTNLGVYFELAGGDWLELAWESFSEARILAPGALELIVAVDGNQVSRMVASHNAELMFLAWAAVVSPDHPQFTDDSWLPPGWIDFARAHGRLPAPIAVAG